ncbi:TetR/AcrR family transcriptional regulator [uncultured Mycolicibacterium sp.]|uniref:TetR/AcrR family transcriptional regulator n=1 Tax=uncultured Mycolicibacterium sp. TaxID=2320817 RepID=UPI002637274F|nr:TetR/AcrR family transcriptional regulator [uncultured Mycolicibacterium sp.]
MRPTDRLGTVPVVSDADGVPDRRDAARNRARLLEAARRLVAERGPDAVSMDDIAAAAGVGKGTLFRRFGSRAGLMLVLLDEDEKAFQERFLFGPPPLGPGAPPLDRLLAYGRERLQFVHDHHALLSETVHLLRDGPATLHHTHVRALLAAAGTSGDLDAQAAALLALLDPDYVAHQVGRRGRSLAVLAAAWADVARKLCGR